MTDLATAVPAYDPDLVPAAGPGLAGDRVLFVGLGATAVCWYRCVLPALFLGADWMGVTGDPDKLRFHTGLVKGQTALADPNDYDVVVLQQPRGEAWKRHILGLRSRGITVLYEVDDYVHGIKNLPTHDFSRSFRTKDLRAMELCMRVCDGIICSTEYIARRYRKFNRTWVCENGVDLGRYRLTRPPRPTVNIGWAGGTGHARAIERWLPAVERVMEQHDDVCFVTIGQPYADRLRDKFPTRCLSIPFTLIENYPCAMTMLDVALAPADEGTFFAGKSDLRWVEAGALAIPCIADPRVYLRVEDQVNGFVALTVDECQKQLELTLAEPERRTAVGAIAKQEVTTSRSMEHTVRSWESVIAEVRS